MKWTLFVFITAQVFGHNADWFEKNSNSNLKIVKSKNDYLADSIFVSEQKKYSFDLDQNGEKDIVVIQQIDFRIFINITVNKSLEYETFVEVERYDGKVEKIKFTQLEKGIIGLAVFLFEGSVLEPMKGVSTGRLHFIALNLNYNVGRKTKRLYQAKGPLYYQEVKKNYRDYYVKRRRFEFVDVNSDNTKEFVISDRSVKDIFYFKPAEGILKF